MLKKIFVVLFAIIMVALLSSCGEQEEPQSEEEAFVPENSEEEPIIKEPQGDTEVSVPENSDEETEKVYPIYTNLTADDENVKEAVSYIEAIATNWFASMLDNDPMVVSWEIKSIEFDVDRTNRHISYFFENGETDEEALYENIVAILVKTEINVKEEFHEGFGGFGEQKVWHEGNWEPLYTDCFYLSCSEAFYREGYDEMYRKYAEDFETKWKIINYGPY